MQKEQTDVNWEGKQIERWILLHPDTLQRHVFTLVQNKSLFVYAATIHNHKLSLHQLSSLALR